jgi:hypothetical protein
MIGARSRPRGGPAAASLEQCAELLGTDLTVVREAAAKVEPYVRVDGTEVWSLMQLERQPRPEASARAALAATSPAEAVRTRVRS